MSRIVLLVINYFNNYVGSFGRSRNKTKYSLGAGLLLIFGGLFIFLFSSMAISTMETALSYVNNPDLSLTEKEILDYLQMPLYVTMGMIGMFVILLMVSKITSNKKNNDVELLLSLPIKKSEIVLSKIIFNYVFDLGMILSTLLPSFIVYFIYVPNKPDMGYFIRCGYLLLIIPMLSNALGSLISYLFNFLTRRFVKAQVIKSIITVVFLVFFLLGYYALQFYFELFAQSNDTFALSDIVVLRALVDFVLGQNWLLYGVIITLICLLPFILCVVISAISLGKHTKSKSNKNKTLVYKESSVTKTLLEQEVGRYFGSNTYVMNTLFGGILLVILSVAYFLLGDAFITSKITALTGENSFINGVLNNIPLIIIMIGVIVISTISISSSSISFEGKNIWIIKVNPVGYKDVFRSKILCNFIISSACALIASLFFGVRFIIDYNLLGVAYYIGFVLLTVLFSLITSSVGLFINLIFPKLDWQSEAEVIKQSMASGITLLINMVIGFISTLPIIIMILFTSQTIALLSIIASLVIMIIMFVVTYLLLNTIGKKHFDKI